MEVVKGWKTVVYGILIGLIALLSNEEMATFLAEHIEWIGSIMGMGVIILRALTTSPIFEKEPDKNFEDSV